MESLAKVGLTTVQRFKLLEEVKQLESAGNQLQEWPKNLFLAQFDRFELWAVNLGLFVMGHGSLDYRIRDSESMKESIYMMIESLNRSLDEVLDYANGNIGQDDEDSDTEPESESDIDLLLGSIKDPIDRLYKLAVWIRNPATRLASSKARNYKQIDPETNVDLFEAYENYDYDYVSSLFLEYEKHKAVQENRAVESKNKNPVSNDGEAGDNDQVWEPIRGLLELNKEKISKGTESFLVRRIARANGRRRQQFAYWKRHKDKLREHASIFVETPARQVPNAEDIISGLIGETKTVLSVTTATQLQIAQMAGQEILEKEGVLKLDVSEYAPSAWNPSKDTVSFPPPPKISTSDNFFECPYCYTICPKSLLLEKAWRAHIIRDLRPYVCTYEQCLNSVQLYDTRDEWIQHEVSTHQRIFRCSKHEEEIFTTLRAYEEHVQDYHKGEAVSSKFATSAMNNVHRSCPVCSIVLGSIQKLQSHIALHLERFAMFSLPRHVDNDEQSDGESQSNEARLESATFTEYVDLESRWSDRTGDDQFGTLTKLEQIGIPPVSAEDSSRDEGEETPQWQQCAECGTTFKSSDSLQRHMFIHHSEPYKGKMVCGFCPGSGTMTEKSFTRVDNLKRHMIKVHSIEQSPPSGRRKTSAALMTLADYAPGATGKCSTCSKIFNNAQIFYDHLDDCLLRTREDDARRMRFEQERREEEEAQRIEDEAQRGRLIKRFNTPESQEHSRRRRSVYEDGRIYRFDESPERAHISANYDNDDESETGDISSAASPISLEDKAIGVDSGGGTSSDQRPQHTTDNPDATFGKADANVLTQAATEGVAFDSPEIHQQHDRSQIQGNTGPPGELNAENAHTPIPISGQSEVDSSPVNPANIENHESSNMDDALNYLDKVKNHFQDKPEIYEQFLETIQNIKEQQTPLQDAYSKVSTLFNSAPDLLEDLKRFLSESRIKALLGHPGDGATAESNYTPQPYESSHIESSTERAQDGSHLQEDVEAQEDKQQLESELQNFRIGIRILRQLVDKEVVLEDEETEGGSKVRDLARQMDILKSEVGALKDQYDKEPLGALKDQKAQELTNKCRSLDIIYVQEVIKEIQANRKNREALEATKKEADSIDAKNAAAKKEDEEVERLRLLLEEAELKAEIEYRARIEAEQATAQRAAEADAQAKQEPNELVKKIQAISKAVIDKDYKQSGLAPIKFKDAVGRKFSFPFYLCNTWQGMEELIKQAFLQVDVIGPHVQEGHYDLIGPGGDIILPSSWEKVIEPGWLITMTMWPLDKEPPVSDPKLSPLPYAGSSPPSSRKPRRAMAPPPPPGRSGGISPPLIEPPGASPEDAEPPKKKGNSSNSRRGMQNFFSGKSKSRKHAK